MLDQLTLPNVPGPALIAGPVFVAFEIQGEPGHKARHRSRIVFPKPGTDGWKRSKGRPFIHNYPDPATEAYERIIKRVGTIVMRGRPPAEGAVVLLVHSFRSVPKSWSQRDRALALAGGIRPTTRPDWDNYGKITDALNKVVWNDDSQVVDGRVIKRYSDRPALRIEVRQLIAP